MRQVQSSNIAAFDYALEDEETGMGLLTVQFRNGRTYIYELVAVEDADQLVKAADEGGSVGSVFSRVIRPFYVGTEVEA